MFFVISLQYRAEYSTQKEEAEDSPSDQKVLSVLSSPNRARDTDITLGASPTNQEGIILCSKTIWDVMLYKTKDIIWF